MVVFQFLQAIASSAVEMKIHAINPGIKKYKSIIKKKKKKHMIKKTCLISKIFIDSYINHDKFFIVTNAMREYNKMKEEIKNPKNAGE